MWWGENKGREEKINLIPPFIVSTAKEALCSLFVVSDWRYVLNFFLPPKIAARSDLNNQI